MLYLDTSLIVSSLTNEPASERVQFWLGQQEAGTLMISDWVMSEFSSALSIKLRIGAIDPDGRATALATFARLSIDRFQIAPVSRTDFTAAARFADRYELGLRAADALHLAVSAGLGTTLCTLDRRLADAGPALGVPTVLV